MMTTKYLRSTNAYSGTCSVLCKYLAREAPWSFACRRRGTDQRHPRASFPDSAKAHPLALRVIQPAGCVVCGWVGENRLFLPRSCLEPQWLL